MPNQRTNLETTTANIVVKSGSLGIAVERAFPSHYILMLDDNSLYALVVFVKIVSEILSQKETGVPAGVPPVWQRLYRLSRSTAATANGSTAPSGSTKR